MFHNILFICVGNICRSPTAEYLMRHKLGDAAREFSIASAGLGALVDRPIDSKAGELLVNAGVDPSPHRARQVQPDMLRGADLVLVMEPDHLKQLLTMAPELRGRAFLLGKWNNDRVIPDPYRRSMEYFERIYGMIDEEIDPWLKVLSPR